MDEIGIQSLSENCDCLFLSGKFTAIIKPTRRTGRLEREKSMKLWYINIFQKEEQDLLQDAAYLKLSVPVQYITDIKKYRQKKDRIRSLAARILTEYGFREYGCRTVEPATGASLICRSQKGKPYLPGAGVHFSLSHAGDYVAAVFDTEPCGIDLQDNLEDPFFLRDYFTNREWEWCRSNPVNRCTRLWTIKESYGKWTGNGLSEPKWEISFHGDVPILEHTSQTGVHLFFKEYDLIRGYAMTVCSARSDACPPDIVRCLI